MSTAPATRLPRTWIIWIGVLLTVIMALCLLAWWLLPRWAPELVIAHAPWPEPALRAWRLAGASAYAPPDLHQAMEAHLLDWGPDIGPALRREFEQGDERYRMGVIALASEVARADGIAAGTTMPEDLRPAFSDDGITRLREDLVQLVLAAMADGSSYLPSNASYLAMSLRDPRTVAPACAFLAKQKPPVFEDLEPVIRFLGAMRDPRAVPALIHLLPIRHKPHPTVEEALSDCLDDSTVDHVIAATRHEHEVVRTWAAKQLARFHTVPVLVDRVVALIADPERQVATAAMAVAVQHAPAAAGPAMLDVAGTTTDEEIRLFAIMGMGSLAYAPARPFLRAQATARSGYCGRRAILALGGIRDPADAELLLSLLTRDEVAQDALSALEQVPLSETQRRQVDAARGRLQVPPP